MTTQVESMDTIKQVFGLTELYLTQRWSLISQHYVQVILSPEQWMLIAVWAVDFLKINDQKEYLIYYQIKFTLYWPKTNKTETEYDFKVLYLEHTVGLWWFGQITSERTVTVILMYACHRLENYISLKG